jgi:hypothetical protein
MPGTNKISRDPQGIRREVKLHSKTKMPVTIENDHSSLKEPGTSIASKPSQPIIYRYIYTDIDGEIIKTLEDTKPIEFTSLEATSILTDKTVIEVITSKKSRTRKALGVDSPESVLAPSKENTNTHIKIHSSYLINALREVLNKQWDVYLDSDIVKIDEPYRALIYHQGDLLAYKTRHPPGHNQLYVQTCNYHIDVLLGFLDVGFGKELRLERQRHQKSPPMATHKYLWLLFKPGDDVFVNKISEESLTPMTVFKTQMYESRSERLTSISRRQFLVEAWHVQSTQTYACFPQANSIVIEEFEGEKEISTLPVFPKEYMRDYKSLESQFIARGKKWFEIRNLAYKQYLGRTLKATSIDVYFPIPPNVTKIDKCSPRFLFRSKDVW